MKVQWLGGASLSKSQQSLTYSACTPAPVSHFSAELRNLNVVHAFPPVNRWSLLVPPSNISLVPPFPCLLFLLPSYSMVLPSPLALCIPCWPVPLPPGLPSTQLPGKSSHNARLTLREGSQWLLFAPSGSLSFVQVSQWPRALIFSDTAVSPAVLQKGRCAAGPHACPSWACWKVAAWSPSQRDSHTIL